MSSRPDIADAILDPARTAVMQADWLPGYELLSMIGTGGFGTIFKARQLQLDRVVAVKVVQANGGLDPAVVERFEAEALMHGKLHHPNIVEVYDSGRHGDRMFIAMELLEGEDLGQRIDRTGPLPERVAWSIARQTAAALAYAAASRLVHRDIKPANLFLTPAPSWIGLATDVPLVKVTDFGLALTRWAAGQGQPQPKSTGVLLGTPLYMAPEQYRRPEEIDHRADIYALGATVVQAITGHPPFEGARVWEILGRKLGGGPQLDRSIAQESAQLLAAMTAVDPNDRPATYDELIARIDQLPAMRNESHSLPAAATLQSPIGARFSWKWRKRVVVPAALAVAVLAALLGRDLWASRGTHHDDHRPARYASVGLPQSLLDGVSLRNWLPPASGGIWQLTADEDSEPVLMGVGFTRRTFAPVESYRLTLGVDVHESARTEVHFAIPAVSPDTGKRLVLQISRSGGAILGTREGDKGVFRPRSAPIPFPPPAWFKDRKPYLEVRVEQTGRTWTVWFNGQRVGSEDMDAWPTASELRVSADGGQARINSVFITTLKAQ